MYLLYADESGSIDDPNGDFFVLAGCCLFERQTHWVDNKLESIANRFSGYFGERHCELHGSPMFSGRDGWKLAASVPERVQAVVDSLDLLDHEHGKIPIFISVIEKSLFSDRSKIIPTAFKDIAFAFDSFLKNIYYKNQSQKQRGIMIFDNSTSERMIQDLSYTYKHIGKGDDKLRNFAEVPMFIDSKASRIIQLADLVAYWIYRYYQSKDNRGFNLISPHIYQYAKHKIGLIEHISEETRKELLENANDQGYPFPNASS